MDETTKELMTIRDLAERWGVSIDKAKKHVRKNHVPFVQIGTDADVRTNWAIVRFRLAAIQRWEQDSERVFDEALPADKPKPLVATGRHKLIKIK